MIRLYGTPLSHFTRKVRIVLMELELNFEFINVGNVGDNSPQIFSNNPLMRVPIFEDQSHKVFESDNIAFYIATTYDPQDRFRICNNDPLTLNTLAVISGVMEAEVRLILAQRGGMKNIYQHHFFQKSKNVIINGLKWLSQQNKLLDQENLYYEQISCVCMWDHLQCYQLVDLTPYEPLHKLSEKWNKRNSFITTNPVMLNS